MYKFVALCALLVCSQAAPTDKPIESDSIVPAAVVTEKSLTPESVPHRNFSSEKREKREDDSVSVPANDNKRTPALSQPDYQENKPPTFVHPVPVDQIIKHSNASPEIHAKHVDEEREEDVEPAVEENLKSTNHDDDDTEEKPKPKRVYHHQHQHSIKTNAESHDDERDNHEEN